MGKIKRLPRVSRHCAKLFLARVAADMSSRCLCWCTRALQHSRAHGVLLWLRLSCAPSLHPFPPLWRPCTTRYKEWYYDAMVPFVHYIPVAVDLSDLCKKVEWIKANQTAAEQMSASSLAVTSVSTLLLRAAGRREALSCPLFLSEWGLGLWWRRRRVCVCVCVCVCARARACACARAHVCPLGVPGLFLVALWSAGTP